MEYFREGLRLLPALLLAAGVCVSSLPAQAQVGAGLGAALNAATTAAVAGYGAQAATTATDDDD